MKHYSLTILLLLYIPLNAGAQTYSQVKEGTIDDTKITIRYNALKAKKSLPKTVWSPSETDPAIIEFNKTVSLEASIVPKGKYAIYFESAGANWKVILNRKLSGNYESNQDVVSFLCMAGSKKQKETQSQFIVDDMMNFIIFEWMDQALIIKVKVK